MRTRKQTRDFTEARQNLNEEQIHYILSKYYFDLETIQKRLSDLKKEGGLPQPDIQPDIQQVIEPVIQRVIQEKYAQALAYKDWLADAKVEYSPKPPAQPDTQPETPPDLKTLLQGFSGYTTGLKKGRDESDTYKSIKKLNSFAYICGTFILLLSLTTLSMYGLVIRKYKKAMADASVGSDVPSKALYLGTISGLVIAVLGILGSLGLLLNAKGPRQLLWVKVWDWTLWVNLLYPFVLSIWTLSEVDESEIRKVVYAVFGIYGIVFLGLLFITYGEGKREFKPPNLTDNLKIFLGRFTAAPWSKTFQPYRLARDAYLA
jgi:hypothetical protein